MTTETIVVGSCPACAGPAQFIGAEPEMQTFIQGLSYRHVELPNIDENLGGGWHLRGIDHVGRRGQWRATALRNGNYPGLPQPVPLGGPENRETSYGDSPSQAYLALRSAIEKRRG